MIRDVIMRNGSERGAPHVERGPAGVRVLPIAGLPGLGILLRLQWPARDGSSRVRTLVRRLQAAADQQR